MSRIVLLRAASLLSLVLVAGSTYLLLAAQPRSASEIALFKWMQLYRFDAMGFTRSHWDFYRGLGLIFNFNFLLLAALLWRLAASAGSWPEFARPMIGTVFLGYAVFAMVAWLYFFSAPAAVLTAAAVCLGIAYFSR
ncbi:MAG: hypothetical protein WBO23_08550 [Burkholderiales bacterium]